MNRIEHLVLKYNIEILILGITLLVTLILCLFDPNYNNGHKLFYLLLGTILMNLFYRDRRIPALPEKMNTNIFFLWLILSFFANSVISKFIRVGIHNDTREHIFSTIAIAMIMRIVLMNVMKYQKHVNKPHDKKMNKVLSCFFPFDLELFIITYSACHSYISMQNYTHRIETFVFIVCGLVAIPTIIMASSDDLRRVKHVCIFYTYLITPLVLFDIVYKFTVIYNTSGIRNYNFLAIASVFLITNTIIYRRYLNLKNDSTLSKLL